MRIAHFGRRRRNQERTRRIKGGEKNSSFKGGTAGGQSATDLAKVHRGVKGKKHYHRKGRALRMVKTRRKSKRKERSWNRKKFTMTMVLARLKRP